jgi:hypothetical protein
MALTVISVDLQADVQSAIRPGDVVFHYDEGDDFPLHVGLYIGAEQVVRSPLSPLSVRGLPGERNAKYLGDSNWGEVGTYQVHSFGQRLDVDNIQVKETVQISSVQMFEQSQLGQPCRWKEACKVQVDYDRPLADGIPRFVRGTCAQFVEFLYELAGLELLASKRETSGPWPWKVTFDPKDPKRIYPATQIHVFWSGNYGLRTPWDERYADFPACLFGERSQL